MFYKEKMTITLNTIYNSYVAKKNKDYASTPLSKVVSYEEKAVGIDNHFVAEDGIVWIGQTIDFIPANVCLLLHCNSKGIIGQPNCNQRKILAIDCGFNRTTDSDKNAFLETVNNDHVSTEYHAIWYASEVTTQVSVDMQGVNKKSEAEPIVSIMPDEDNGYRHVMGYAMEPLLVDMIDLFNAVSIQGVDDFVATFDLKKITDGESSMAVTTAKII